MRRSKSKKIDYINIALSVILAVVYNWLIFLLYSYRILTIKIAGIAVLVTLVIIALMYLFKLKKSLIGVQIIIIVMSVFGLNKVIATVSTFDKMNSNSTLTEETMYVLVKKGSKVDSLADLNGQTISAPVILDEENIELMMADLEAENITIDASASYMASYEALMNETVPAMIFNQSYDTLLADIDENYLEKTKIVFEKSIAKEIEEVEVTTEEIEEKMEKPYLNIYLSGIDTYGALGTVSRSDSNVIVTVNKETGKILLTNTPRDSFVRIPGGGANQYDKLTHAGIYGVETSMHTLENLYNIDIDYYVRVNFSSLMNLVKVLGSIEVDNNQSFTTRHGNITFPKGRVTLTSDTVLPFVRERYNLSNGDYDRGRNHEKVIAAIIKKLLSPSILLNYNSYLEAISNSVQTNITFEEMVALINEQIANQTQYNFESQDLSGHGTMTTNSYAMSGQNLYVMEVNQASLNATKAKIISVEDGK